MWRRSFLMVSPLSLLLYDWLAPKLPLEMSPAKIYDSNYCVCCSWLRGLVIRLGVEPFTEVYWYAWCWTPLHWTSHRRAPKLRPKAPAWCAIWSYEYQGGLHTHSRWHVVWKFAKISGMLQLRYLIHLSHRFWITYKIIYFTVSPCILIH